VISHKLARFLSAVCLPIAMLSCSGCGRSASPLPVTTVKASSDIWVTSPTILVDEVRGLRIHVQQTNQETLGVIVQDLMASKSFNFPTLASTRSKYWIGYNPGEFVLLYSSDVGGSIYDIRSETYRQISVQELRQTVSACSSVPASLQDRISR
jgi:hypothetical protein